MDARPYDSYDTEQTRLWCFCLGSNMALVVIPRISQIRLLWIFEFQNTNNKTKAKLIKNEIFNGNNKLFYDSCHYMRLKI